MVLVMTVAPPTATAASFTPVPDALTHFFTASPAASVSTTTLSFTALAGIGSAENVSTR